MLFTYLLFPLLLLVPSSLSVKAFPSSSTLPSTPSDQLDQNLTLPTATTIPLANSTTTTLGRPFPSCIDAPLHPSAADVAFTCNEFFSTWRH